MSDSEVEHVVTVDYVLELLGSRLKQNRDRGIKKLEKLINVWEGLLLLGDDTASDDVNQQIQKLKALIVEELLSDDDDIDSRCSSVAAGDVTEDSTNNATTVEHGSKNSASGSRPISRSSSVCEEQLLAGKKHGYLMACYPIIGSNALRDDEFTLKVRDVALTLLTHPEIRVQLAAGGVLGYMSKYAGASVYEFSKEKILSLVQENLEVVERISEQDELKSAEQGFDVNLPASFIRDKVIRESMGWRNLEPSLKCLQFMIENLDSEFIPFVDSRVINLIFHCLSHPVRFVKETGFQIFTALIGAAPQDIKEHAHQLSRHLANGLSDNWNQVRMAAAITTRRFFLTYKDNKEAFYPILLPKLCLNRYYTGEGIRTYIQESWKLIVGIEGRNLVAIYMDDIVKCYLESTKSSNLSEREAACACIAELATKIDPKAFTPHLLELIEGLVACAQNESWSVRDAACLACGNFITQYAEEWKPYMETLYQILFQNLGDPILLLRQGAATALGNIATAYGTEALDIILPKVTIGLTAVESMKKTRDLSPSSFSSPEELEEGQGHVMVEEDTFLQHEPQCEFAVPGKVLVTSESLTKALIGNTGHMPSPCFSCRKSKLHQPWHLSDGSLYLIGTLAAIPECKSDLEALVPLMIKATEERSYPEHYTVLETFCKILPLVARAIGKRPFKESLQQIFEPIFYTVASVNPMTSAIGKTCLVELAVFLGPNILRSRVELIEPRFLHLVPD